MSNPNYEWKPEFNEWIKQFGIRLKPSNEEAPLPIEQMQMKQLEQLKATEPGG